MRAKSRHTGGRKPQYTACRFNLLFDDGQEHLVFAVNRSLAAAGHVVDAGNRVGGMPSWCCEELASSVVDNVPPVLFFFLFLFIDRFCSSEPCIVVFQIIPLCSLSFFILPSVWTLADDPQDLSPFQFLLCFHPICDVVCRFFLCTQSSNSSSWLDVLSVSFSNEILLS